MSGSCDGTSNELGGSRGPYTSAGLPLRNFASFALGPASLSDNSLQSRTTALTASGSLRMTPASRQPSVRSLPHAVLASGVRRGTSRCTRESRLQP